MKVAFHTLGCKVNQYETESMRQQFVKEGFEAVGEEDFADLPDDLMDKYEAMFRKPEILIATPMGCTIMPVDAVVEIQIDSE